MKPYVDIEEGMVIAGEYRELGRMRLRDYVEMIANKIVVKPIFLPYRDRGCACFAQREDRKFFLIYLEPIMRLITYWNEGSGVRNAYNIIFPHCYIGIFFRKGSVSGGYAFVTKEKITRPTDQIGRMPLPNTNDSAHICEGRNAAWPVTQNPIITADSYVDFYLQSEFTAHINSHWNFLPPEVKPNDGIAYRDDPFRGCESMFENWQAISKEKGKEGILELNWIVGETVQEMLERIWATIEAEGR